MSAPDSRRAARRSAGGVIVEAFFNGLAAAGKLHPRARPERHGVEVVRDVAYRDTGLAEHRLDIYRPAAREGPLPVVLYVHGGGFHILSKESHWLMGLVFARRGYVVFNVNYRLAPRHRFPVAVEDVCHAYRWVVEHAARFGGDPARIALAGESAGANLITALSVGLAYPRPEPFMAVARGAGVRPSAVLPACGIFQVTQPERFLRKKNLSPFVYRRIAEVTAGYLATTAARGPEALALADPLCWLEQGAAPESPLPPFLLTVGTKDPLLDDTRRLAAALGRLNTPCEAHYYPGEIHAFHAFVWREHAKACWRTHLDFLARHLPPPSAEVP